MASVRGATLLGPDKLEVREYPVPDIPADGGLVKVEMGGVCGTDVKYLHGKLKVDYPIILGHEILGRVEKLGKNAAAIHHVKEGDRIILKGALGCGRCADCRRNNQRFCRQRTNYGGRTKCDQPPHLFGGFADYIYLAPDVLATKSERRASRRSGGAYRLGDGQWLSVGDSQRRREDGRLCLDPRPGTAGALLHLRRRTMPAPRRSSSRASDATNRVSNSPRNSAPIASSTSRKKMSSKSSARKPTARCATSSWMSRAIRTRF